MQVTEIIFGVVLCIVAVGALVAVFSEKTVIPLGITVIAGLLGFWLIHHGIAGEHAKFRSKHETILADLTRQGFKIPTDDVYAVGGNYYVGTEADVVAGPCLIPLIATRQHGTWHAAFPTPTGGLVLVTPSDLKLFAAACR